MIEAPAAKAANAFIFGALFSASLFGISVQDMAVGTFFAVVGVCGRGMVDTQKLIEKGESVKLGPILGWIGAGFVGSPFITMVYLAVLKGIHYPVDAFTALVLLTLGYLGPKAVNDLMSWAGRYIPTRANPGPPKGD